MQAESLPAFVLSGSPDYNHPTGGMLALWVYTPATLEDEGELAPEFDLPAGSELLNPRVIFGSDLSRVTLGGPVFPLCTSQPEPAVCYLHLSAH